MDIVQCTTAVLLLIGLLKIISLVYNQSFYITRYHYTKSKNYLKKTISNSSLNSHVYWDTLYLLVLLELLQYNKCRKNSLYKERKMNLTIFSNFIFRYSLNGGIKTVPVPYLPADTARSVSSTSEYGVGGVTSRPNSRHSHRPRGPASTSGSNSGYYSYTAR